VLRTREAGVRLEAAFKQTRERVAGRNTSLFAALRMALPDVEPSSYRRRGMLAISRAIEDHAAARADGPVWIGAFQRAASWRATEQRWRHLAASADVAVALATLRQPRRQGSLWEIPIAPDSAVAREWAVICEPPTFTACLVGVERPVLPGAPRTYEGLWTVEPDGVRAAARAAMHLIDATQSGQRSPAAPLVRSLQQRLTEPPRGTGNSMRSATSLTNRVVEYLEAG
jgi:DICT domain-containing protein